jgi:signal transduction histidine kinase
MVTAMPGEEIKALLVFPSLDDALELRELLTKSGSDTFLLYRAERADEAIRRVSTDEYSVVIANLDLPDASGPEFVDRLREAAPRTPLVIVSDRDDVESGLAVVHAGAQDCVMRRSADPGAMHRSIRFAIERARQSGEVSSSSSQQIEVQDQFLSQFSHELRSPITAIYQFITILLDGLAGDLTQEQREYLEITLRNINLMRDMVRDLMDVTRAQTGKLTIRPRCTSVVTMIAETVIGLQTAAQARNINLAPIDLPYVPPVMADPGRIRQILNNLCDNALKFCGAGDTISLSAHQFEQDKDYVCISVRDTGCGISKEGREQVFEYLYQDQAGLNYNHKGLGIGLAICRELVTQHGGRIWVESEPGKGSLFSFTLPTVKLADLIAPLNSGIEAATAHVQLVTIEVRNGPQAKFQLTESIRQRIWNCLDRGSRTGYEILMPRTSSRPEFELFFLLVNSSEQISTQQVRARLMRDAQIDETMVDVSVSIQSTGAYNASESAENGRDAANIYQALERAIENRIRQ